MAEVDYEAALRRLEVLVGDWEIETSLDVDPALGPALVKFEWVLNRSFLFQSAHVPVEGAPDLIAIIATDPASGAYTQHYFDSRGVVRLYEMELTDESWVLRRTEPDSSELHFSQRYTGAIEGGGDRIVGRWEKADDGADWEVDFELSYIKR